MPENNNNTSTKPIWNRRWFRVTGLILIIFGAILIATPYLISNGLKSYLLDNGADNVFIEDIDFNPFTGSAAVKGLDVRIGDTAVISNSLVYLDISLMALLKKGVAIEAATINKLVVDIEQSADGKIRIGSLVIDPGKAPDEEIRKEVKEEIAWWLGLGKITLNDCVVHLTSPRFTTSLFLDDVSLQNLNSKPGDQSAKLNIKARLNKSDINAMIHLEELTPELKAGGNISIQKLDLNEFTGITADLLDKLAGLFDLSGKFSVSISQNSGIDTSYTGNILVSGTDVGNKDFAVTGTELKWDGNLSFKTKSDNSQQTIKLDGELGGSELALVLPEQDLSIQQQEISLNPKLSLQITDDATSLSGTTNIQASGTRIEDTAKALTLLAINKLDMNGVNATALDKIKINGITLQETGLIQSQKSEQPTIAINSTTITDLNYTSSGVVIQSVAMGKLTGSFVREKDGSIDISNEFRATDKTTKDSNANKEPEMKEPRADTEEAPSAGSFGIKINEIIVKDDSILNFNDKAVSPAFKSVLDIASLKITDIDSSKPDQPIAIKLNSKLNKYATLSVNGSITPFKEKPGVDLKVKLHNQNMVALSPYLISTTGYLIHSGQLNFDSTIVINDGSIDAKNTFFVKKLKLEEADATVASKNAGSIGMPLDKALGMLRDKNDNIKLEMPITGKLDEIQIGTGQIINTALKKATTAGMKTYLLLAFQPYGALIMVGQAIGKQAGKINLDPVVFEAGDSMLTSKHKDYLEKLGKVMQDRPKIDVQICTFTTIADLSINKDSANVKGNAELSQMQTEKSLKLGKERQAAIKDHLISRFKIDDGRLILCSPEYDDSKDAKPRVELLI